MRLNGHELLTHQGAAKEVANFMMQTGLLGDFHVDDWQGAAKRGRTGGGFEGFEPDIEGFGETGFEEGSDANRNVNLRGRATVFVSIVHPEHWSVTPPCKETGSPTGLVGMGVGR